jgi:hypothetical protein
VTHQPTISDALAEKLVVPYYLRLLGGAQQPGFASAVRQLQAAVKDITDAEITALLDEWNWRTRLIGGWIVALTRRRQFVDRIAALLIESDLVYAGQGYCAAFGLIGDADCCRHLRMYLGEYLPPKGRIYDQVWAIGALTYAEGQSPVDLLVPELWDDMNPLVGIDVFRRSAEAVGME